jgi:hypothetical protein
MGKGIVLARGWRLRYGTTPASTITGESNDTKIRIMIHKTQASRNAQQHFGHLGRAIMDHGLQGLLDLCKSATVEGLHRAMKVR